MEGKFVAERGGIYKWQNCNTDNHYNYCVVVSSDNRQYDKLVSVLFLSTDRGAVNIDTVCVNVDGEQYIVRTDLVTYTQRSYLVERVGTVSDALMWLIDSKIIRSLGLQNDTLDYKELYESLLNKIVGGVKNEQASQTSTSCEV